MQFRVSRGLITDLTAGEAPVRAFLPRYYNLQQPVEFKIYTYRKIITYYSMPVVILPMLC